MKRRANGLEARLERLEARHGARLPRVVHRVIVESETRTEAVRRYEQEAGVCVGVDDLLIFRTIVMPGQVA